MCDIGVFNTNPCLFRWHCGVHAWLLGSTISKPVLGQLFLIFWFTRPLTVIFAKGKIIQLAFFIFCNGRQNMSTKNIN